MRIHEMRLADQAFQKIKSGSKKLELRIGDDKRRAVALGDLIRFHCMDGSQSILVEVLEVLAYEDFFQLYLDLDPREMGYCPLDLPDPRHMYAIYPPALIKEKGALAFRIRLLDPAPQGG